MTTTLAATAFSPSFSSSSSTTSSSTPTTTQQSLSRLSQQLSLTTPTTTVIVGLHAALQKRLTLQREDDDSDMSTLVPGHVHRAHSVHVGVGGKGQNVATTLRRLHFDHFSLAQFVGRGAEGDTLLHHLTIEPQKQQTQCQHEPILHADNNNDSIHTFDCSLTVRTASGLRTCTSIVTASETTELIEPSGIITEQELQELYHKVAQLSRTHTVSALCIMGSLPPGCPDDTYAQLYLRMVPPSLPHTQSILTLIDSVTGLEPLLDAMVQLQRQQQQQHQQPSRQHSNHNHSPTILKCNTAELFRLAHMNHHQVPSAPCPTTDLVKAISKFIQHYLTAPSSPSPQRPRPPPPPQHDPPPGIRRILLQAICITDGPHPAYLAAMPVSDDEREWRLFQLPVTDLTQNSKNDTNEYYDDRSGGDDNLIRPSRRNSSNSSSSWDENDWIDLPVEPSTSSSPTTTTETAAGEATTSTSTPKPKPKSKPTPTSSSSSSSSTTTKKTRRPVYPIGAGDAVAAGTLAAWKALTEMRHNNQKTNKTKRNSAHRGSARDDCGYNINDDNDDNDDDDTNHHHTHRRRDRNVIMHPQLLQALSGNESPLTRALLAAFAFGLACGTASCLQQNNSVVAVDDVLHYYHNKEGRPIFLASYDLPPPVEVETVVSVLSGSEKRRGGAGDTDAATGQSS